MSEKEILMEIRKEVYGIKELEKFKQIRKAKTLCKYLTENGIDYEKCIKHGEVLSCDESKKFYYRFRYVLDKEYVICKNILVQERKGEKRIFLIITDSNKQINFNSLRDKIDCRKLEFVSDNDMQQLINTYPGNVSIFNMLYDKMHKVTLIIDKEIMDSKILAFHPLYNGMSLFIKSEDCIKFLDLINRISDTKIISIDDKEKKLVKSKKE